LDAFFDDDFDQASALSRLQELDEQRATVARAVGAVIIEGPYTVAHNAESAAIGVEEVAGRLRAWISDVARGREHMALVQDQMQYARRDQYEMQAVIERFADECRKVLHPTEIDRPTRRRRRWRW
jgi:ABC-type histidine transport system ATPase subunit